MNSISSYLKHLTVAPLAGKLTASQRANWMVEMTVSMSRKVLIEASSDASILSSVVGSYNDHNTSGSASFMQQRSSSYNSSLHSSNLFSILLNLMEPSHVSHSTQMHVNISCELIRDFLKKRQP